MFNSPSSSQKTPLPRKWPEAWQWQRLFKVFSRTERIFFLSFLVLFLASGSFLSIKFYLSHTQISPANGGTFTEGVIGQPRFINPIYAPSNDVDKDLTQLVYSGIMKYDQNGNLVDDLAKDVQVQDNGTVYDVFLKDNVFWSDSSSASSPQKVTADDVVYTIKTIQDPDYKSPLRTDWINVDVEKVNDFEVEFKLANPYAGFMENLTVKIIPQHIWQNISAQNFPLSPYNQQPVGSGPYKVASISQDGSGYVNSILLKTNQKYSAGPKPHISEIRFKFYQNEDSLIKAAKGGQIDALAVSDTASANSLKGILDEHLFPMPRYFAVFFNPNQNPILSNLQVRQALNYGTNKEEIINKVFGPLAKPVDSPILPDLFGFQAPSSTYAFDPAKANSLLDAAGFTQNASGTREQVVQKQPAFQFTSTLQTGSTGAQVTQLQTCLAQFPDIYPSGQVSGYFGSQTKTAVINFQNKYASEILTPSGLSSGNGKVGPATRKKLNELCEPGNQEVTPLKITLTTVNQPDLVAVANLLKSQWAQLGVDLEISTFSGSSTQETNDIIKSRNYDALLYGQALQSIPDPFPYWDSIQIKDPGLNLAAYENEDADKLLQDARQTLDPQQREIMLEQFQNILISDAPAVFLYSPDYIYFTSDKIKNINPGLIVDPSQRFADIGDWYINTQRTWK